jgi:hypothetical protein
MVLASLADTFGLWSIPVPAYFNRVDRPSPFLALLNVRYLLLGPGQPAPEGCRVISEERATRVCEIPALSRAFAPRNLVWTENPRLQLWLVKRVWNFGQDGVAGGERPGPLRWLPNGEADVRFASYAADRMALEIDARSPAFIGTTIPGWRGWKLTVDGKRAPLLAFDRAFLGFEVPAGKHEAKLRYLPDGFLAGAAISVATAALILAAAIRERMRRPSE